MANSRHAMVFYDGVFIVSDRSYRASLKAKQRGRCYLPLSKRFRSHHLRIVHPLNSVAPQHKPFSYRRP